MSLGSIEESYEKLREAGRIASEVVSEAEKLVKPGVRLLDVAEQIEEMIVRRGGMPAFPCNISIGRIAAHYTPHSDDDSVFSEEDVVKIDIGVHVDGYIADVAITIDLSEKYSDMVRAAKEALERALKILGPGVSVSEIGAEIEDVIRSYGYTPIYDLTGHELKRWILHGGRIIPNYKARINDELREGDVFAIEPFACDGEGRVAEGSSRHIYSLMRKKTPRAMLARRILEHIEEKYRYLPFADRWIEREFGRGFKTRYALNQMEREGILRSYPVLVERKATVVTQFEHTAIITENGCEITTRI